MELTRICIPELQPLIEIVNFTLYKGITFRYQFEFVDENNDPIPISGQVVNFYIVDNEGESIININSSSVSPLGSTISTIDSPNGIVEILITDEETLELSLSSGYWWITLTLSNGDVNMKGKGLIYLKEPYN